MSLRNKLSVQEHMGQWVVCYEGKRIKVGPAPHNSTGRWVYPESSYVAFPTKEAAEAYSTDTSTRQNEE